MEFLKEKKTKKTPVHLHVEFGWKEEIQNEMEEGKPTRPKIGRNWES